MVAQIEPDIYGQYIAKGDPDPTRRGVSDSDVAVLKSRCIGKSVLEIGTGVGVSTRAIAEVAESLHTVDIDPWVLESIYVPPGVTRSFCLPALGSRYDVVFIDGGHTFSETLRDIHEAVARSDEVLVHDYNEGQVDVKEAVHFFLDHFPGWELVDFDGIAMLWRKNEQA